MNSPVYYVIGSRIVLVDVRLYELASLLLFFDLSNYGLVTWFVILAWHMYVIHHPPNRSIEYSVTIYAQHGFCGVAAAVGGLPSSFITLGESEWVRTGGM